MNSSVQIEPFGVSIKVTQTSLHFRRAEVSELKHTKSENVLQWHGQSEQETEQFTVALDAV